MDVYKCSALAKKAIACAHTHTLISRNGMSNLNDLLWHILVCVTVGRLQYLYDFNPTSEFQYQRGSVILFPIVDNLVQLSQ